jgi:hypothetical protein
MSAGAGPAAAVGVLLAAFVPVILLALLAASMGNCLAGLFVPAMALAFLAWRGGPIDGWMRRHSHPGSFAWLAVESLGWLLLMAGIAALVGVVRPRLRAKLGGAGFDPLGLHRPTFAVPDATGLTAGAATAIVAGVLALFLLRSTDVGQITFGLIVCFTIASLMVQYIFPHANPLAIVLSPMLLALGAYLYARFGYSGHGQVIDAWHRAIGANGSPGSPGLSVSGASGRPLPGLALALPIHYASAGIIGTTIGVGWAQTMMLGHRGVEDEDDSAPAEAAPPGNGKASA